MTFVHEMLALAERVIERAARVPGEGMWLPASAMEMVGVTILREARHAQGRAWEAISQGLQPEVAKFLAEDDMGYQTASVLAEKLGTLLS